MPQQSPFSQEQLDQVARSRGFRNYNHMIFVMQNGLPQPRTPGEEAQRAKPGNFFSTLLSDPKKVLRDAFAIHPAVTIGRAADALGEANRRRER